MSALNWNERTVVASGGAGSYAHDDTDDYTFRIYATATRNGRSASLYLEYTVIANNSYAGYEQYSGPWEDFYVDGVRRSAQQIDHIWPRETEQTLATYTKALTADAMGVFPTVSAKGVWTRNGTSGYAPKNKTIENTAIQLSDIEALGASVKVSGAWKHAQSFVKVDGAWKPAQAFVKVNGTWKAAQ